MLRIGLIGCGRIGKLHAETISNSNSCKLSLVTDVNRDLAESTANACGSGVAEDLHEIVNHPDIDAVFICSYSNTHAWISEMAISAGKAVLCEKPLDLDLEKAADVLTVLARRPVPFTMGFHRRFDRSHSHLKSAIMEGRLGKVELIQVTSRGPSPPTVEYIQSSGGMFHDSMVHDLDVCRWLAGEEFSSVFCRGSNFASEEIARIGDFDTASASLWTESGILCSIMSSRRSNCGLDHRVEVFGSKSSAEIGNHPVSSVSFLGEHGYSTDSISRDFMERYADAYPLQLEDFARCVGEESSPRSTAEDGHRALQLAEACMKSATSGKVVKVE